MSRTYRGPYIVDGLSSWGKTLTELKGQLLLSPIVDTGHWQATKDVPNTMSRELQHVHIQVWSQDSRDKWAEFMADGGLLNKAWADEHFAERVSGVPSNPGAAYQRWPWYRGNVEKHKEPGEFSHTYQERIWSRFADAFPGRGGIRYRHGDLNDLVNLLRKEPYTRQAYLPIWFPEDLAAAAEHEQRVPCTLGWHFMLRDDQLHCFYPMRSVDLYRYLTDDIYMAGLLQRWIIERLKSGYQQDVWSMVRPGRIEFFASSLHIFDGDVPRAQRELDEVSASELD